MSRWLALAFILCAATSSTAQTPALRFAVPPLTDPVVDQGGMLQNATKAKLDVALRRLWNDGGSQVAVLTVTNLGGIPIEDASIQVTDAWKLGSKSQDNGVLLLISKEDRSVRIEVGQGREGDLPDAYARRIVDDMIVPAFKAGDIDSGVIAGVKGILARTDPNFDLGMAAQSYASSQSRGTTSGGGLMTLFKLGLFFLVFVAMRGSFFGRRRGWRGGGGWGGGGGGGGGGWGGGGGGGFSGGGGGFSGGGASGKW